jgi:phenylacetate-CoA ligase
MDNLIVEVIKEDGSPAMPGETGDLIITDLHNYGMPFIRYRIGDMAVATDHVCSCGRGLTLLADVVGRSLDVIRTRDGRNVPGEFFPHLMKEFKGIDRFQVIQDEIDHLEVKIVKNAAFSDGEYNFIRNEIVKVVGGGMRIDYSFVASIPLTRTGKFRVTISEI